MLAYVERTKAPAGNRSAGRRRASPPRRRRRAGWPPSAASIMRAVRGSGPGGAVLAADVLATVVSAVAAPAAQRVATAVGVGNVWRIMAERMTASWTSAPHFYLVREVTVSRLVTWRERAQQADRRADHLHGSAGAAGGGDHGAAPARQRLVEGRRDRAARRHQHRPGRGASTTASSSRSSTAPTR